MQELYEDDWVAGNAIKLLQTWDQTKKVDGKPFFMQVNFPGPHPPFAVTAQV